jgi:hypothetical protein
VKAPFADRQGWIILEDRFDPHQYGIRLRTKFMRFPASLVTGNPTRGSSAGGNTSVQGYGGFQNHFGTFPRDAEQEILVQGSGFILQKPHFHGNTGPA